MPKWWIAIGAPVVVALAALLIGSSSNNPEAHVVAVLVAGAAFAYAFYQLDRHLDGQSPPWLPPLLNGGPADIRRLGIGGAIAAFVGLVLAGITRSGPFYMTGLTIFVGAVGVLFLVMKTYYDRQDEARAERRAAAQDAQG